MSVTQRVILLSPVLSPVDVSALRTAWMVQGERDTTMRLGRGVGQRGRGWGLPVGGVWIVCYLSFDSTGCPVASAFFVGGTGPSPYERTL
jgi:hypothetical protein